ncbi:MAG TPA: glycosyltransferase family 87 protein, partial [Streptosporangiaceae bacterium]|nr:glycosyltransferase family 87 protein [Streptosporangiaceae bacterium]
RLPDGSPYGRDFLQFVYVAEAWRAGTLDPLYDPVTQVTAFRRLAQLSDDFPLILRYNYPPFFAWLPHLLSGMQYRSAYVAWLALQLGFLLLAIAAWRLELADRPGMFRLLLALLAVSPFLPFNLMIGQTGFIGLASLSWACRLLRTGRDFSAGVCVATLLYKSPLGIVLGPLLLLKRRWHTVGGVAAGGAVLLIASLLVSPRALGDYLTSRPFPRSPRSSLDSTTCITMPWRS